MRNNYGKSHSTYECAICHGIANSLFSLAEVKDNVHLNKLRLEEGHIQERLQGLDPAAKELIDNNVRRIRRFAQFQLLMYRNMELKVDAGGVVLGQRVIPLDTVGVYAPGGRFPLLSSGLMTVVPAKVAGVRRIIAATPPGQSRPHPAVLYGLIAAGATEIYTIGGAQAIAAMAIGTSSVPKVDKILGPGNRYVNEAKKQLFGEVGIDLLAGPSEVLIFADDSANFDYVVYDLLAQAEHDPDARACLVTTSQQLAERVTQQMPSCIDTLETRDILKQSWQTHGSVVVVESVMEGIRYIDQYAPEHLELHLKNEVLRTAFMKLRNYGSIFLGASVPVVFSDKLIGPNSTLPTGKAAMYTGGLSVGAYLKIQTYQQVRNRRVKRALAKRAVIQSHFENLAGHEYSAKLRT